MPTDDDIMLNVFYSFILFNKKNITYEKSDHPPSLDTVPTIYPPIIPGWLLLLTHPFQGESTLLTLPPIMNGLIFPKSTGQFIKNSNLQLNSPTKFLRRHRWNKTKYNDGVLLIEKPKNYHNKNKIVLELI